MMNSMNSIKVDIQKYLYVKHIEEIDERELAIDLEPLAVVGALSFLKNKGFAQLSLLTCIDRIKENKFQLVYILFNWDNGIHLLVRTKIDRGDPKFITVTNIYPGAQYYEREVHEFFGVEFDGNEDSFRPLFLERWDDIPPLRKDFDPQAYSDKKFPKREHPNRFRSYYSGEGSK